MIRKITLILFALIILLNDRLLAGTISGTVRDAKDTSTMIGVIVTIQNSERSAQTDIDGHYEFQNMPDGTYTLVFNFVSYNKVFSNVTLAAEGIVTQDIMMKATGNQLKGAVVKTTRRTNTESSVILEIKKASVAVSGISAAQISKTQDRNAADVVKRIAGVTIQDDKFIIVRGLAERYNLIWLNDAGAPSSEVDKKAFSFDLIPAGLIDRILIFKTPAADLPGDFAGGMAKIYTTSMPSKTEYSIGIQGSYRNGSTGTDFNYLPSHSGDIIGYDNGSRNLPSVVPDGIFNKNDPNSKAITQAFTNDWAFKTKSQSPDLRLSATASNIFKFGGLKIGNTLGAFYSNTKTNYKVQNYDWTGTVENYQYSDLESVTKVNLSVMENIAAVVGNSKIEFKNLYNQTGINSVTSRSSIYDSAISSYSGLTAYQLGYENRKAYITQICGTHHNESDTRKYIWTLGYNNLYRNQPGLRRLQYGSSGLAQIQSIPDVNQGGGRLYGSLKDKSYSFSHQFTQKISFDSNYAIDISLGNYIEYKDRSYNQRELGYTVIKGTQYVNDLLHLPVDQIFASANVGDQTNFRMEDATAAYDHYSAKNTLIASFISAKIPVGNRIKALIGLRYENNRQQLETVVNLDTIKPDIKTNFLLPSLNVSYQFNAKSLIRVAYGKTVNRPEFREQAPAYFYDFSLRAGTYGALYLSPNPLKVAEIQNFDVRWEFYPSPSELIHAGFFYKSFKNPIQQAIVGGLSDKAFTFINGNKAYVAGIEVDARKNMTFLDDHLGTKYFKNFTFVGNVSLGKSELTIDSNGLTDNVRKGPLQGQSNVVINVGLFYQSDSAGILGSLLYNNFSPRLYAVGRLTDGSIGETAFHSLDLSLSKVIAKRLTITLGIQNLLDATVSQYEDINLDNKFDTKIDKPFKTWKPGQYFTIGLKVRL